MQNKNLPIVSIILPVRNEEKYIKTCLEQVFSQIYPKEKMEVLVVDGMSKDKTREIARQFPVRILNNPKGQRASGLNVGIKNSRGEIFLRVDARTLLPEDYIQKCTETLLNTEADNVGGLQRPILTGNIVQGAIGLAAMHSFGVGGAEFRLGKKSGFADSVYLGCFRKEIFEKIGLFDEKAPAMTEDSDINWRIKKAGGKVYLNKDIIVYYIPRDNLRDLWRLYFRYGGARAGFFLKHKILKPRQIAPLAFMLAVLFLLFLSAFNPVFFIILSGALILYILADFLASLSLTLEQKNAGLLAVLMLVFPCMHFSWASGFIVRILQRPKPGTYWGY